MMLAAYTAPKTPAVALQPNVSVAVVRNVVAPAPLIHQASFSPRAARDLGTDAALAGGEVLVSGFHKVALR